MEVHVQGMLGLCRSTYHESVVDRAGYDIYSLENLEIMSHSHFNHGELTVNRLSWALVWLT